MINPVNKLPCTKTPCSNCPFRKDTLDGWLGEDRMREMLNADSFVCHKKNRFTMLRIYVSKKRGEQFLQIGKENVWGFISIKRRG